MGEFAVFIALFLSFALANGLVFLIFYVNRRLKNKAEVLEKAVNPTPMAFTQMISTWANSSPENKSNKEVIQFLIDKGMIFQDDDGSLYKPAINSDTGTLDKKKIKLKDAPKKDETITPVLTTPKLDLE